MCGRRKSPLPTHRKMAKKDDANASRRCTTRASIVARHRRRRKRVLRGVTRDAVHAGIRTGEGKTKDYVRDDKRNGYRSSRRRSRRRPLRAYEVQFAPARCTSRRSTLLARTGGTRSRTRGSRRTPPSTNRWRRARPAELAQGQLRDDVCSTWRGAIRTRTVRHRGGARGGVRSDALRAVPVPVPLPDARPGGVPTTRRTRPRTCARRARARRPGLARPWRRLGESLQGDTRGTTPEIYRWCPGAGVRRGGGGRPRPRPRTPGGCETGATCVARAPPRYMNPRGACDVVARRRR